MRAQERNRIRLRRSRAQSDTQTRLDASTVSAYSRAVPPFRVRVSPVQLLALALVALLVAAAAGCGGEDEGSFEHGKYEYNLTEIEKDALRAMLPALWASQLDDVDEVAARLEFGDDGWGQTWMLDGTALTFEADVEKHFQRDTLAASRWSATV